MDDQTNDVIRRPSPQNDAVPFVYEARDQGTILELEEVLIDAELCKVWR